MACNFVCMPIADKGEIVRSGGPELALELEKDGYKFLGIEGLGLTE